MIDILHSALYNNCGLNLGSVFLAPSVRELAATLSLTEGEKTLSVKLVKCMKWFSPFVKTSGFDTSLIRGRQGSPYEYTT